VPISGLSEDAIAETTTRKKIIPITEKTIRDNRDAKNILKKLLI
jgi:hypothetical protein